MRIIKKNMEITEQFYIIDYIVHKHNIMILHSIFYKPSRKILKETILLDKIYIEYGLHR